MGFVDLFRDNENDGRRQRWASRTTFVLAAIGSAIGLGNVWRFPYLCFKYGGALFFVPYLLSLFLLGLPMLMLEFSVGQKFQRGDIGAFRGIHPRLAGVGLASVFSAFSIPISYHVIIAWALLYMVFAFMNPLPYAEDYVKNKDTFSKDCPGVYITAEVMFRDVLHILDY